MSLHVLFHRIVDTVYYGKKLYLVFEYIKYDLKRFIDSRNKITKSKALDMKLVEVFF